MPIHLYLSGFGFFAVGRIVPRLQIEDPGTGAARKGAHLRQVNLAVALGDCYDQSMISHLESEHPALPLVAPVKAGRGLGVSLDYLVGLTDDLTPSAEFSTAEITPEIRQISGVRPVPVCPLQTAADSATLDSDKDVKGYGYFRHE